MNTLDMPLVYDFGAFNVRRDVAGGLLLTRCADGADTYFQPGDDANTFEDVCEAIDGLPSIDVFGTLIEYISEPVA